MLLLPLALLPLLFLSAGMSFLMASLGVYLRDMQQLVSIALQVLFFMTPIFYPINLVPESMRWVLHINPLTTIVEHTRMLVLYGQTPEPLSFLASLLFSLVVFQLGLAWFAKTKKGFADVM
jgi:lipopolysaccharide transport system permease protein